MKRHTLVAFAVALCALTVGLPDRADAGDLQIEAGVTTEYPGDSSYDALSENNVNPTGNIAVAYGLPIQNLRVYGEFNATGADRNRFNGDYDFSWQRGMYLAGVDWGPTIGGFFRPFFRVTAGYARQNLQISPAEGDSFGKTAHDFATKNSLGVELFLPMGDGDDSSNLSISDNFSLGLSAQGGYLWHSKADYSGMTSGQNHDDDWQRSGVDVGTLNASGGFWNVGVFMRIGL
jgi:hypothetical protein